MILLDTCAYLWFFSDPGNMTARARRRLEATETLFLSLASVWEVALKVQIGKLALDLEVGEWVRSSLRHPAIELVQLTPGLVVHATQLPGEFHKDPFDRAIVATAIRRNLTLVTRDERILEYPHVTTLAC